MRWLIGCCVVAFLGLSVDVLMRVMLLREELPATSQLRPVEVLVKTLEASMRCEERRNNRKRKTCWEDVKLTAEDGQWWWLARLPRTTSSSSVAAFIQPGERIEVGVYGSEVYTVRRLQPAPERLGQDGTREVFSDAELRKSYAAWVSQQRTHLALALLAMLVLAWMIWRWRHQPTVASVIAPTWLAMSAWLYPTVAGEPFPERVELRPQFAQFAGLGAWVDCEGSSCQSQTVLLDQQGQRWPLSSAATLQASVLQRLKPGTPLSLGLYEGKVYSVTLMAQAAEAPSSDCGYRLKKGAATTQVTWQCGPVEPDRNAGFMEQLRHAQAKQAPPPERPSPELISYDLSNRFARELRQGARDWVLLAVWGLFSLVMTGLCFGATGSMPIVPVRAK